MVSPYSCYPCDTFTWNNGINNWELASPCISNTITLSLTSVGSYNWNGQVITNSGSYTWVGTNSFGCDSIVTLNLTITQQPYFCCDSITYWTDQSQGFNVGLDTTGIVHNPDSLEVWWAVCANGQCYPGQGMYSYYPQITTADTVKVGYDVYLYENGVAEVCSREDWLVFDGTNWVLLNMNPTSINELTFNKVNDNKIYDLLGRELNEIPVGTMYIKNNKLYITK